MSVNLDSCFYTSQGVHPTDVKKARRKNHQHFLRLGKRASASMEVAYSASKGGINAFPKLFAKELSSSNIQVNAIACGVIDTAMNSCFSEEDMEMLREEIPADRIGKPHEVAELILQVIQAPAYMTGQIITIDSRWI